MKRLLSGLGACLMLLALLGGCAATGQTGTGNLTFIQPYTTENDPYSYFYDTVAQKDGLTLAINPNTTDIAVTVDATGYTWSTANVREGDIGVYPVLYMDYSSEDGKTGAVDSTNHSINKGQYTIEQIQNGVKVSYTLGEVLVDYVYPTSLTPERYEYWMSLANDSQKDVIALTYTLKDISFYDEITQAEMWKKFPHAVDGKIYDLRRATMTDAEKNEIARVMGELGYTKDDLKIDHTEYVPNTAPSAAFNVSVYYTLENGGLVVRVPAQEISYDSGYHVQYISVLQNFTGAAQAEGYFLLPDGSGSLMHFNNGKSDLTAYRVPVYGAEDTIYSGNRIQNLQNASLPVYGSVEGTNAYMVMLDQGASLANINAFPGSDSLTARAWVDYSVEMRDYDFLANTSVVFDDIKLSVYGETRYAGDYSQVYRFFSGAEANYSHMAAAYRKHLFGTTAVNTEGKAYPLSAELIGTVDTKTTLFGTERSEAVTLTTFNEMQDMAEDLLASGVSSLDIRISGWFGNGYRHGLMSNNLRPLKEMGGEELLKKTVAALKKQGVSVSLEADPQYAYQGAGSVNKRYISRMINESNAVLSQYNFDTFAQNKLVNGFSVLTPDKTVQNITALSQAAVRVGANGIVLRQTGEKLNADYNKKATVFREEAAQKLTAALNAVSQNGTVTVSDGNAYTLSAAGRVVDFPVVSNKQDQTNVSVPFFAMVVSGQKEYAGGAINLSNSSRTQLLSMIESAAGAAAVFTKEGCADINVGEQQNLYATQYAEQKEGVLAAYRYVGEALSDIYGKTIVSHEIPAKGVAKITTASGHWVMVNYNNRAVTVGGVTVEPLHYAKGGN